MRTKTFRIWMVSVLLGLLIVPIGIWCAFADTSAAEMKLTNNTIGFDTAWDAFTLKFDKQPSTGTQDTFFAPDTALVSEIGKYVEYDFAEEGKDAALSAIHYETSGDIRMWIFDSANQEDTQGTNFAFSAGDTLTLKKGFPMYSRSGSADAYTYEKIAETKTDLVYEYYVVEGETEGQSVGYWIPSYVGTPSAAIGYATGGISGWGWGSSTFNFDATTVNNNVFVSYDRGAGNRFAPELWYRERNYVEYINADGSERPITQIFFAGSKLSIGDGSNMCVPTTGDRVTFKAGLRSYLYTGSTDPTYGISIMGDGYYYATCELAQDVSYSFNGTQWIPYIAATDFTIEEGESLAIFTGEQYSLNIKMTPADATDMVILTSDNEAVIQVTADGRLTPAPGAALNSSARITVQVGTLQKTIEVIYLGDAEVTGLKVLNQNVNGYITHPEEDWKSSLEVCFVLNDTRESTLISVEDLADANKFAYSNVPDFTAAGDYTVTIESLEQNVSADFTLRVNNLVFVEGSSFGLDQAWGNFPNIRFVGGANAASVTMDDELLAELENYFTYTDIRTGETRKVSAVHMMSEEMLFIFDNAVYYAGDVIEIKEGLRMYSYVGGSIDSNSLRGTGGEYIGVSEINRDHKYVFDGERWVVFREYATGITINEQDGITVPLGAYYPIDYTIQSPNNAGYATPKFSSSDVSVFTVDAYGVIAPVATGDAELTVSFLLEDGSSVTQTIDITITEAEEITEFELGAARDWQYVITGEEYDIDKAGLTAWIKYGDLYGEEFALTSENTQVAVDTSAAGEKEVEYTITYKGVTFQDSATVHVYDLIDEVISGAGVADYYGNLLMLEFTQTTFNASNILTTTEFADQVLPYVHYYRWNETTQDWDELEFSNFWISTTNIALFPGWPLKDGTYDYREGDRLVIDAGLTMFRFTGENSTQIGNDGQPDYSTGIVIPEGKTTEQVEFRHNGDNFRYFKEYTDIQATNEVVEVILNNTAALGVVKVPSDATTGTFSYESADPTIASISITGTLRGLKIGETVVTATIDGGAAGKKTVTVTVKVIDGIKGLTFNKESIDVQLGSDFSLEGLTANFVYESGTIGDEVSLENATIRNFDSSELGTRTVIISVTVDGVAYSGQITVNVVKGGGCSGATTGTGTALGAVVLLTCAVVFLTRKKADK